LICGQGSLLGELLALTESLGLADRVRFLGVRDDIPTLMSAADGFALSSDLEGLPLVLLQASAAGLPIVATDVGGNGEVVEPGVNGALVKAGDPESFAREMAHTEGLTAAERASLGRAGQERVRSEFEADRVMERWAVLYDELLGGDASLRRHEPYAAAGSASLATAVQGNEYDA
jgi:glycosyltransferase involved in cell wall biosynthesis